MATPVYRKGSMEGRAAEAITGRTRRALALYLDRKDEIVRYVSGEYGIPSRTEPGVIYHVDLRRESCECPDHEYKGATCLHIYCALIARAKDERGASAPRRPARRCERRAA